MNEKFESCWSCLYSMLDIGIDAYICSKKNKIICAQHQRGTLHNEVCEEWKF